MQKPKMIPISQKSAKQVIRLLGKWEETACVGCIGTFHDTACPAREMWELRHYLTQRINNPKRHWDY